MHSKPPKRASASASANASISHLRTLLLALFAAALAALIFYAGRLSARRLPPGPAPPPSAADAEPCAWAPESRPLHLQEFLDVPTMPFEHPLLPRGAPPATVHVTKRPGASYGPHAEFWGSFTSGAWEPSTFRVLQAAHSAGGPRTHLDIGGWVGPTALFAAHYAARVVALEPDPRAFNELHANARLNPHLAQRMQLHRHCLAAASGPVTMTGPAPLGSSMSRVGGGVARIPAAAELEENWGARMVSWPAVCSTPADFAARAGVSVGEVALVKVDVEGAEAVILPPLVAWLGGGALGAGGRKPPLLVELHVKFWAEGGAAAAAVAGALARYRRLYVFRAERPGDLITDNLLQPFDALAALGGLGGGQGEGSGGSLCPGGEEFCMVLAVDEEEEPAWVKGLLEGAPGAGK
jgi:FkbM family methyltransferase